MQENERKKEKYYFSKFYRYFLNNNEGGNNWLETFQRLRGCSMTENCFSSLSSILTSVSKYNFTMNKTLTIVKKIAAKFRKIIFLSLSIGSSARC